MLNMENAHALQSRYAKGQCDSNLMLMIDVRVRYEAGADLN